MPVMKGVLSTADTNPGASAKSTGPKYPPTHHDHLPTIYGKPVAKTDNEELRAQMAKMNIEGWQTSGRDTLLQRYRERLREIHDTAGELAVTEYLKQFKE